jgi:hypothetical protein
VRSLLDSIAWASYGAFAHLATADDRHRARPMLHDLLWVRLALASLAAAVVIAVNRPFVTMLFGGENFGGLALTAAFGGQMIMSGQMFLANYLLRAAGPVREGSYLLAIEAVVRVGLMAAGLWLAGLPGAPVAAVVSSAAGLVLMLRRLDRVLIAAPADGKSFGLLEYLAHGLVVGVGVTVGAWSPSSSWMFVVLAAAGVAAVGGALLLVLMPSSVSRGTLLRWRTSRS